MRVPNKERGHETHTITINVLISIVAYNTLCTGYMSQKHTRKTLKGFLSFLRRPLNCL